MGTQKLVYGVGINDADYIVQKWETIGYVNGVRKRKIVWACPFYRTWAGMLERAYSKPYQNKQPTYIGCSVSEPWKTFSIFRSWMEKQDWKDKELDKDLLFEGNRVYSAETCVFVSKVVNNFVIERVAKRGEWPIGVCWSKEKGKFKSQCSNQSTKKIEYLGYFDCEHEAHRAWLARKLELAHLLAAEQTDTRVAKALIERYTNYTNLGETL